MLLLSSFEYLMFVISAVVIGRLHSEYFGEGDFAVISLLTWIYFKDDRIVSESLESLKISRLTPILCTMIDSKCNVWCSDVTQLGVQSVSMFWKTWHNEKQWILFTSMPSRFKSEKSMGNIWCSDVTKPAEIVSFGWLSPSIKSKRKNIASFGMVNIIVCTKLRICPRVSLMY